MNNAIEMAINEVNKILEIDGGKLELVKHDPGTNTLWLGLSGECTRCSMLGSTFLVSIEGIIKKFVPAVEKIHLIDAATGKEIKIATL